MKKEKDSEPLDKTNEKIANKLIVLLLIIIGVTAILAYTGQFNESYHFTPPAKMGGFLVQQNPNFPADMNLNVFFTTTSLSAQNPIHVEAKLFPSIDFSKFKPDAWGYLPEKQYIAFPYALQYPLKQDQDGSYLSAIIELKKQNDPREYSGSGDMIYQFEGEYGYVLLGSEEVEGNRKQDSMVHFGGIELVKRISNQTIFPVGSADQTATLKTNGIFLALTLIFVGFGVVELREHIVSIVGRFRNKR